MVPSLLPVKHSVHYWPSSIPATRVLQSESRQRTGFGAGRTVILKPAGAVQQ